MITNPTELLQALRERGLMAAAEAEAGAADDPGGATPHERPWAIGALLGVSGWIAGLFVLGFVGLLFRPDTPPQAAVAGAVLLAAAWGLFRADREGAFAAQLALALSIAGQCLMLYAMTGQQRSLAAVASAAFGLQLVLALLMPNRLHRVLSTLFAGIAWALALRFGLFGEPEFWRHGGSASPSLPRALAGWVLAWGPIGALLWALLRHEAAWMARGWQPVLRPVMNGLIGGLAFATLASQPSESLPWLNNAAAPQDWLALWPLLSALGALGAVAAGFALRSRAAIGAGAGAVLLHVGHFYYQLGASLLFKSVLMLAMGGAMLLAARALRFKEPA